MGNNGHMWINGNYAEGNINHVLNSGDEVVIGLSRIAFVSSCDSTFFIICKKKFSFSFEMNISIGIYISFPLNFYPGISANAYSCSKTWFSSGSCRKVSRPRENDRSFNYIIA